MSLYVFGGLNTFGYVYQNPLIYVDPDGHIGRRTGVIIICIALVCTDKGGGMFGGPIQIPSGPPRESTPIIAPRKTSFDGSETETVCT